MPQKFWMVWVKDTPTTSHRHTSYESALVEAERIARQPQNAGKKVYILMSVDYRFVEQQPLTTVNLTYELEIPVGY